MSSPISLHFILKCFCCSSWLHRLVRRNCTNMWYFLYSAWSSLSFARLSSPHTSLSLTGYQLWNGCAVAKITPGLQPITWTFIPPFSSQRIHTHTTRWIPTYSIHCFACDFVLHTNDFHSPLQTLFCMHTTRTHTQVILQYGQVLACYFQEIFPFLSL